MLFGRLSRLPDICSSTIFVGKTIMGKDFKGYWSQRRILRLSERKLRP
jgi:hypothetical protein